MTADEERQKKTKEAWGALTSQLTHLETEYYDRGKLPGVFEAKKLFTELVEAWKTYREAAVGVVFD